MADSQLGVAVSVDGLKVASKKVLALERWKSVHQVFTGKVYSMIEEAYSPQHSAFLLFFSEKRLKIKESKKMNEFIGQNVKKKPKTKQKNRKKLYYLTA